MTIACFLSSIYLSIYLSVHPSVWFVTLTFVSKLKSPLPASELRGFEC